MIKVKELTRATTLAAMRAINRAIESGRVQGIRALRQYYNVRVKDVRAATSIYPKARFSDLRAVLNIKGNPLPVSIFSPRERLKRGTKYKEITVKIKKGGIRRLIPGAFLAQMRYTKTAPGVFIRQSAERSDVKHLYTLSLPQMWDNEAQQATEARAREQLEKELKAQMRYYIERVK